MAHPTRKRKCQHCKTFFHPDHRNVRRQRYCSKLDCRQASKVDSQQRWRHKPENPDDFTGAAHVQRVRQWRLAHPGYWRRPTPEADKRISPLPPDACNNEVTTCSVIPRIDKEVSTMHKQPLPLAKLGQVPRQFSWVDQRLVREGSIDRLSHEACTLYLFLLTVADALESGAFAAAYIANLLEQRARFTPQESPLHLTRREDRLDLRLEPPDLSVYQAPPTTPDSPGEEKMT